VEDQDQKINGIVSGKDEGTKILKGVGRPGFEVMILLNFGAKFWSQITLEVNTREMLFFVFFGVFEILRRMNREILVIY
jgi:hypothetical protein